MRPVTARALTMQKGRRWRRPRIFVGGHLKGGNLAIAAAAANLDRLGDRLLRVYSHDGPGFLDAVYDLVTVPGATTVSDLVGSWQTTIPEIRERLAAMDPETRAVVVQTFREVASIGLHRIPPTLREFLPQRSARGDDAASGPADRSSPQSPDDPDTVAELSGVPSRVRRRARAARAEERGSGIALIGRARARRAVEDPCDSAPELGNEGAAGP